MIKKTKKLTGVLKKGDYEKEKPPDTIFTNVFVELAADFTGKKIV